LLHQPGGHQPTALGRLGQYRLTQTCEHRGQ